MINIAGFGEPEHAHVVLYNWSVHGRAHAKRFRLILVASNLNLT